MFRVITIAGEYGSGGSDIAQRVAAALGWRLLDNNLIEPAAWEPEATIEISHRYDERLGCWWHRMSRRGQRSTASGVSVTPAGAQSFDAGTKAARAPETIAAAAAKGQYVIVDRAGQCVLRNRPDAFHVFVYAPWTERVTRVRNGLGTNGDIREVIHSIRSADEARATYVRMCFGCDWKAPHLYHLMINSKTGEDNVARLIIEAVEGAQPPVLPGLPSCELAGTSKGR